MNHAALFVSAMLSHVVGDINSFQLTAIGSMAPPTHTDHTDSGDR